MTSNFKQNPEDGLKVAQGAPKGSHGCPKTAKGTPKDSQREPKGTQRTPKWSPRAPKGVKRSPKSAPGAPKTPHRHPKEAKGKRFMSKNSRSTTQADVTLIFNTAIYPLTSLSVERVRISSEHAVPPTLHPGPSTSNLKPSGLQGHRTGVYYPPTSLERRACEMTCTQPPITFHLTKKTPKTTPGTPI